MLFLRPIILFIAVLFLAGCSKDDPKPANDEELITEVHLSFQKLDASQNPVGNPLTFSWVDADGALGSGTPLVDDITLEANATYSLSLDLIDGSSTTPINITEEIADEADEHQFFFLRSESIAPILTIEYRDEDENERPLGLSTQVHTTTTGSGSIQIVLRHQPDKGAAGVAQGEIENAGGETDIQVEFPLSIGD